MTSTIVLRRHGDSVELTIPADTLERMGFEVGQELTLIEMADGLKLVKRNPALERQIRLARDVLHEQAAALQDLASR